MKNQPKYANWISWRPILKGLGVTLIFLLLTVLEFRVLGDVPFVVWIIPLLGVLFLGFALYLLLAKVTLSYRGGKKQAAVLDHLLTQFDELHYSGQGRILDIGCGSGALSIKAAQKYPEALVTGIDYWGENWYYSKMQCEKNAELEGVANRITFQTGDAAKLAFEDGTFDAIVSNLVFHEVRTQPNKLKLVAEALRVLKPGGVFVLQDVYFASRTYGDIGLFVEALGGSVTQLELLDLRHPRFAPFYLSTRFVIGNLGSLRGVK